MDTEAVMQAFSALAQPTRLQALRLLVKHEPEGLPAGDVARHLKIPHNTLSVHLATLRRAGLVSVRRESRSMIYRARLSTLHQLMQFLLTDCCNGQPELCLPRLSSVPEAPCCPLGQSDGT
jgi:ArsR family transcriptional regulator